MFNISADRYTDAGDRKETNQDSVLCRTDVSGGRAFGMFIVADGCGGLAYGGEISGLAVTHMSRIWDTELRSVLAKHEGNDDVICSFLEETIQDLNKMAVGFSRRTGDKTGTTLSLLLINKDRWYIKNTGDSRVYLIRKGRAERLTEDQSLMADMLRNNELTLEQVESFKETNVLTMCVGYFDEVKTFTRTGRLKARDSFLLCSDGLYNHLPEGIFDGLLKRFPGVTAAELCQSIPKGGAMDNVSAILVHVGKKSRWFG